MASLQRRLMRAAGSRYFYGLVATVAIVLSSASRVQVATGDLVVYGPSYTQDTVFSTTLLNGSTVGGSLTTPSHVRRFWQGQRARLFLDCAALAVLPPGSEGAHLCAPGQLKAPVDVLLDTVDQSSGQMTWHALYLSHLPIGPGAGARIDSVVYGPGNMATDAAGRVYLVDGWNSRIAVFAPNGAPLYTLGHYGAVYSIRSDPTDLDGDFLPDDPFYGYPGTGPGTTCSDALGHSNPGACPNNPAQLLGSFNMPNDVAVSADGLTIAVADSSNHRVQVFKRSTTGAIAASDGTTRFSVASFGTWGIGLGQPSGKMSFPAGVAVGDAGRVAIADTDNSRISVFDPDPSAPSPVTASDGTKYRAFSFGQFGDSAGANVPFELNYPLDVAIDPSGQIIVADSANNQVKVYNSTGSAAVAMLGGAPGLDKGSFNYPWGVNADPAGNLLVADTFGQRVQVLTKTPGGFDPFTPVELPPFYSPVGIVATPDGGFTISEWEFHRIVKVLPLELSVGPISVSASTVESGQTVAVNITATNTGAVDLTDVTPVLKGVPPGSIVPCTPSLAGPVDLDVDASYQFTVCFVAGSPATLQVLASSVGFAGPMQATAADLMGPAVVVVPAPVPRLTVTAIASPARLAVNDTFTVDVQLANEGQVALSNIVVAVPPVAGITFLPAQSDALTPQSLATGASSAVHLTFRVLTGGVRTLVFNVTTDQRNSGDPVGGSASVAVEVVSDVDPPTILSALVKGPAGESPNAAGWIQFGPATLTITAADAGTGLQSISYRSITLSTGTMNVPGAQHAATFVGGPFYSFGQGETLVSFWAEDMAGNARRRDLVPHEVAPGTLETVQAFCTRLPNQCVSVNVDPLRPDLLQGAITFSDDNSEARVPFSTSDSQSGIASVRMAGPQPGARIEMEPGSNSRGTLVLTSEGPEVSGDITVTDRAGLENTFRLPLQVLRLDHTAPDGFNRLDPTALGKTCTTTIAGRPVSYLCTNKVYGVDDLPGFTTAAIPPSSVVPIRWGGDYDGDDRDFDDDDSDGHHHRGVMHADKNHDGYCDFHRGARFNDDHRYGWSKKHDRDHDGHHDRNCPLRHGNDDDDNDRPRWAPSGYHWFRLALARNFWDRYRDNHNHRNCDHDHDWDNTNAELHTYTYSDAFTPASGPAPIQVPNKATLIEKVRQSGNEARVRVMGYQYQEGTQLSPMIVPEWAYKKYEWETERNGTLKSLNQKMELGQGHDRVQVLANYDARSNKTTIKEIGPGRNTTVVRTGLVLLKMTTDDEELKIVY